MTTMATQRLSLQSLEYDDATGQLTMHTAADDLPPAPPGVPADNWYPSPLTLRVSFPSKRGTVTPAGGTYIRDDPATGLPAHHWVDYVDGAHTAPVAVDAAGTPKK